MKKSICLFLVTALLFGVMTVFTGCGPGVESIELSESEIELKPGDSKTLSYTIFPAEASDAELSWSSSDSSVAAVDSAGRIVAKEEGICTITVTADGKTDTVRINVVLTPEMLMAEGRYAEAYEKATTDEKNKVLAENVIAYLSEKSSEGMKNPDSFVLREGYYKAWNNSDSGVFGQQVVLYLSGTNSYGATVSNYWLWVYDNTDMKWEFWGSETSTTIEKGDGADVMLVKIVIENVLEDGVKLDKSQVENVNSQFEADTLYEVELIPKSDIDKTLFPTE